MSEPDLMISIKLPTEPRLWKGFATRHGVLHKNVCDLENFDSGSRIKDGQFYALRVCWNILKKLPSGPEICKEDYINKARTYLSQSNSWKKYLEDISAKTGSSSLSNIEDIGSFSLVRYNQECTYLSPLARPEFQVTDEKDDPAIPKVFSPPTRRQLRKDRQPQRIPASSGVPHTPTPMPRGLTDESRLDMASFNTPLNEMEESPDDVGPHSAYVVPSPESPAHPAESVRSQDEQIVNMALVLFLQNLTIYHEDIKKGGLQSPNWTVTRLQLKCQPWQAWTDGFLKVAFDGRQVGAILEVKPYLRTSNSFAIQKQESAQMAAWIRQNPHDGDSYTSRKGTFFRRLLISQDCFEVYLNVAEYDSAYVNYLNNVEEAMIGPPSFMIMNQYGPWNTKNSDHMKQLGILMLAFTLQHVSNASDPFTDSGKGKSRA